MHIKVLQENLQENNYGFVKLPILLAVCKYSNLNMLEALRKEIDDTDCLLIILASQTKSYIQWKLANLLLGC